MQEPDGSITSAMNGQPETTTTPPDFTEQQDKDVTGFEAIPLLERAMRTSMRIECDCDRSDYNACHGHCVGSLIWNDIHRARKLLTREPSGDFTERARQLVTFFFARVKDRPSPTVTKRLMEVAASALAEAATQGQTTGRQAFAAELLGHLDRITSTTAAYHLVRNLCLIELGREPDSTGAAI